MNLSKEKKESHLSFVDCYKNSTNDLIYPTMKDVFLLIFVFYTEKKRKERKLMEDCSLKRLRFELDDEYKSN